MKTKLMALLVVVATVSAISADSYYADAKEINRLPVGMEDMPNYRANDYYGYGGAVTPKASANDYYYGAVTSEPARVRPVRDTAGNIVREPVRTTGTVAKETVKVPGKVVGGIFGSKNQ